MEQILLQVGNKVFVQIHIDLQCSLIEWLGGGEKKSLDFALAFGN
jgi:hypothetical protein